MEFKHRQLDNGLTIIGEINPPAQSAAVGFFVRTGSRDEIPEVSGVSHFLEHMLFKGTDTLSAQEVNEAFDHLGADFNAFTSEENTVYHAAVLPEYLEQVAALWMQLMRPSLRDEDFAMEKNVILEEIAMYKDWPQFDVMDQGRTLHFGSHPCGNSVLGSNESIAALTAEQMRAYFSRRYAPNNITLACCGNFDFDGLCRLAEEKCLSWQPADAPRPLTAPHGSYVKQHIPNPNLARQHLCLLSPTVSMQDPLRHAASLLSLIIGGSTGSRFYWALIDPALAETAGMHCDSMDGAGVYYSYICCDPENAQTILDTVDTVFRDVRNMGISQAELDAARNKVLSAMTLNSEQPRGRLANLGLNWVYNRQYCSVAQEVEQVKAVTLDNIADLIQTLQPEKFTRLSLGPKELA